MYVWLVNYTLVLISVEFETKHYCVTGHINNTSFQLIITLYIYTF